VRGEPREERHNKTQIRTSTSNTIHKRSNHLLVELLFISGFRLISFHKWSFRVDRSRNRPAVFHTEACEDVGDVLSLSKFKTGGSV